MAATGYYYTIAAKTAFGTTTVAAVTGATTPGGSNTALRLTIPQVTNATGYVIFLGTNNTATPWVCEITESQRASGGFYCSTVSTVSGGGSAPAGAFDVGVVGTGLAFTHGQFAANNAYYLTGISSINCAGYSKARLLITFACADYRTANSLTLIPFFLNQTTSGLHAGGAVSIHGQRVLIAL